MTQRDRVLAALRHAGPAGLTQVDFLGPQVCDHGKPITRVAARVNELRDQGFTISSGGTRHGCAVYVLKEQPSATTVSADPKGSPMDAAVVAEGTPELISSRLFDPVALSRPLGAYDDIEEAA
jgi:hypothetical protein